MDHVIRDPRQLRSSRRRSAYHLYRVLTLNMWHVRRMRVVILLTIVKLLVVARCGRVHIVFDYCSHTKHTFQDKRINHRLRVFLYLRWRYGTV